MTPKIHELKVWPEFYAAVFNWSKRFELRKNDRDFQKGDLLLLQCYDPEIAEYLRDSYQFRKIGFVLTHSEHPEFGLKEGFCILSLDPCTEDEARTMRDFMKGSNP